jgi:hypothetical protein
MQHHRTIRRRILDATSTTGRVAVGLTAALLMFTWAATAWADPSIPPTAAAAASIAAVPPDASTVPFVSGSDQRCLTVDSRTECFVTIFNDTISCSGFSPNAKWTNGFAETYAYGGWPATAQMTITWTAFGVEGFTGGPSGSNYGITSASWQSGVNGSGLVTLNYNGVTAFGFALWAETTLSGTYTVHGHNYLYSVSGSKLC